MARRLPSTGENLFLRIKRIRNEYEARTGNTSINLSVGEPAAPQEPGQRPDKTFSFVCKQPPASSLLKKAANIASGSGEPHKTKVATITKDQLMEIVKIKRVDLNAKSDEAAARIIAGSARQMGIEIEGM